MLTASTTQAVGEWAAAATSWLGGEAAAGACPAPGGPSLPRPSVLMHHARPPPSLADRAAAADALTAGAAALRAAVAQRAPGSFSPPPPATAKAVEASAAAATDAADALLRAGGRAAVPGGIILTAMAGASLDLPASPAHKRPPPLTPTWLPSLNAGLSALASACADAASIPPSSAATAWRGAAATVGAALLEGIAAGRGRVTPGGVALVDGWVDSAVAALAGRAPPSAGPAGPAAAEGVRHALAPALAGLALPPDPAAVAAWAAAHPEFSAKAVARVAAAAADRGGHGAGAGRLVFMAAAGVASAAVGGEGRVSPPGVSRPF